MAERIAFLGIGLMGAPMAANLLAAGLPLILWNRSTAKAEALRPQGAAIASSAAEALAAADVAITMLESGPVTDAVMFQSGAAAALRPGSLVIDMASIPPATARQHAERLKERGIFYLDAPVSGGTAGAVAASLAIMVGGDPRDFARAQPIFAKLGRATLVGPAGSGQLAKLSNQTIVAITVGAVAEALLLAAASGADPAAVRHALAGGSADSRILQGQGQRMLERNFIPGGTAAVVAKDVETILAAARDAGLTLPLVERVGALYRNVLAQGDAALDHTALLLELERINAPKRLGPGPDKIPD